MPDHVHEVDLGVVAEGLVVVTGPAIENGENMAGAGPVSTTEPEPTTQELRAPIAKRKSSLELAGVEAGEREQAAKALRAGDPDQLPEYARKIWDRMFGSSKRIGAEAAQAATMGWRAVCQKYGLSAGKALPRAARPAPVTTKAFPKGVPTVEGGAYFVPMSSQNMNDKYQRTERVPLEFAAGAFASVGIGGGNHRNLLGVFVPKRLVSDDPSGAGAVKWVARHRDAIWKAAKMSMGMMRTVEASNKRRRFVRFKRFRGKADGPKGSQTFVSEPSEASQRIAFGEVYVPWEVDLQGEYATEEAVEEMANQFMIKGGQSGEMHRDWPVGQPVQSFVARRGDPDFTPGAWVIATQYDHETWEKIVSGDLTGYSMGGHWNAVEARGVN